MLADKIEVCYETAWNPLLHIRTATEMRDEHYVLGWIVEFNDAYWGAKNKGIRGRGAGNQCVFIAVAKNGKGEPPYLKMKVTDGVNSIKPRKLELGNRNIVGKRVTEARQAQGMKQVELLAKLQLAGIDMSVPALSLLEGQKRPVTDIELNALADILNVSVNWLLGRE